jgi:hypothetical protein
VIIQEAVPPSVPYLILPASAPSCSSLPSLLHSLYSVSIFAHGFQNRIISEFSLGILFGSGYRDETCEGEKSLLSQSLSRNSPSWASSDIGGVQLYVPYWNAFIWSEYPRSVDSLVTWLRATYDGPGPYVVIAPDSYCEPKSDATPERVTIVVFIWLAASQLWNFQNPEMIPIFPTVVQAP